MAGKLTKDEVAERMKPTYLDGLSTDDLKEEVETEMVKPESEEDPNKDPRSQNPYTFPFSWTDPRGKVWAGSFTTHYPTPRDLLQAGAMQSRLVGGSPKESLDDLTSEIAFIVARLTFCLDEKPKWFRDPLAIVDGVPLLQAVYSEVLDFEQWFRQHGTVTPASKTKRGNA